MNYQTQAMRTFNSRTPMVTQRDILASRHLVELTEEVGEIAHILKKGVYRDKGVNIGALTDELGDAIWQIAALAYIYGIDFDLVLQQNIEKLRTRHPGEFNPEYPGNR